MWGVRYNRIKNFDVSYQVWGTCYKNKTLINVVFRDAFKLTILCFQNDMCAKHPDIFVSINHNLCFFPEKIKDADQIVLKHYTVFPYEEAYLKALCRLHEGRIHFDASADIRSKHIPRKIRSAAYPLQKQAIESSFHRSRILNFSEMGCGKSLITLGSVLYAAGRHMSHQDHFRVLVVCPSYLCSVWDHEVKTWTDSFKCSIIQIKNGNDVDRVLLEKKQKINFYCMSYAMMVRSKDFLSKKGRFDCCILDEAHYLKNPESKRFKAAKSILCSHKKIVKFLYILTGTPVSSCYADLYPIFSLFRPDIFMSYGKRRWLERYSDLHQGHFGLMKCGSEMPNEIRMLIHSLSIKLETKQVAPETKDFCFCREKITIPETDKGRLNCLSQLIFQIKEDKRRVASGNTDGKENIRRKIMEACLLSSELKAKYVSEYLLERISERSSTLNVLVWVHFHSMSDQLAGQFRNQGVKVFQYDGRKNASDKADILKDFDINEPGVRILIAGINSMQAGVTLRNVEWVFFTENYFSAIGIQQAVARTRRIGVETDTVYTFLEVQGTFDKYINAIVDRKTGVIKKTMS